MLLWLPVGPSKRNIFVWANEAPEMPDYMGDWLEGICCLDTDRNAFRKNLILSFDFLLWEYGSPEFE